MNDFIKFSNEVNLELLYYYLDSMRITNFKCEYLGFVVYSLAWLFYHL